jgi:hypothetical protein
MSKDKIVGAWSLISSEFRRADGQISYPFGQDAMGLVMYDASGNVSAQLMRPDRPAFASGDAYRGTPEEIKAAFEGLLCYFGTYEVDEEKRAIIHHVKGAYLPNWIGTDQVRFFEISGDRLTLSTPPITAQGTTIVGVLNWQRIG